MSTVHFSNVSVDGGSESFRVHVELQDGKDLRKKLLLMQIVKLEGGVHSVYDGMLMYESRKLLHDGGNQASRVGEVVHDVGARDNMMVSIQTVMESGNTINVMNLMDKSWPGSTAMTSVESGHLFVEGRESSLGETIGSGLGVLLEGSLNKSGMSSEGTFFEKHGAASGKLRGADSATLGFVTELPGFLLSR